MAHVTIPQKHMMFEIPPLLGLRIMMEIGSHSKGSFSIQKIGSRMFVMAYDATTYERISDMVSQEMHQKQLLGDHDRDDDRKSSIT